MPKASVQSVADSFYTGNFRAARIIAAEPERYAGIMLEWARAVIAKAPRPKRADEPDRLPSTANSRDGGSRLEGEELLHGASRVGGTGQ